MLIVRRRRPGAVPWFWCRQADSVTWPPGAVVSVAAAGT